MIADFPQRIALAEAESIIDRLAGERMLPAWAAPLAQARGCVLAENVMAPIALPPFDNSAMDGFAVRGRDLETHATTRLRLAGEQFAGPALGLKVSPGHCLRITTGAPMPDGADTVVIREHSRAGDGWVELEPGTRAGANVRRAGEDVQAGETVLTAGTRLAPTALSLAAALGLSSLPVRRRPRVAVFASGDELCQAGQPLAPGEIHDSNGPLLNALLAADGLGSSRGPVLPDEPAGMLELLRQAAHGHDLVVTCGGVSAGEKDHLPALLAEHGRIHFWRVRIKPGMPVLLGELDGTLVLGLPGNPVAVLACFLALGRRLLDGLEGDPGPPRRLAARLAGPVEKSHARLEFLRGRLRYGEDAVLSVDPDPVTASNRLAAAARNDALIVLPEGPCALASGSLVTVLPFARVG